MTQKKRVKKQPAMPNVAVGWYKPNQWPRLKAISSDGSELEETYGEWQVNAEKAMRDFAALGVPVTKVEVDVNDLLAWCKERGFPVDGESRSQYAAWLLQKQSETNG